MFGSPTSTSKKVLTEAERDAILRDANEKMRAYYTTPVAHVHRAKKRSETRDREHYVQALLAGSFLAAFILTPFLGKKIANDPTFRATIPKWYDFSLDAPASAWTRKELHEQLVKVQSDLHERAIRGEFSPDKLEGMRRHFDADHRYDEKASEYGWDKLHPGVDDDEDVED